MWLLATDGSDELYHPSFGWKCDWCPSTVNVSGYLEEQVRGNH